MSEQEKLLDEQLNNLSKEALVMMLVQQNKSFDTLSEQSNFIKKQNQTLMEQNKDLIKQVEDLKEQIAILTVQRFGKKSEKGISGQLSLFMDESKILNEAEVISEEGLAEEPEMEIVVRRKRKPRPKGKRDVDLSGIPTTIQNHCMTEEELSEKFPNGWHQLEDEVYRELVRIPASYEVIEHHISVYAGNGKDDAVIRAESPKRLLNHSILTPSLAASIFTAKYINALPLNRISEGYAYDGINISKQVMAGWMIRLHEYYLEPVHKEMKNELFRSHHIHCDETPFKMTGKKGEDDPKSKDYMWVYHAPGTCGSHPVFLYEYDNGSRSAAVVKDYLKTYKGILVTDGYESYHTLQKLRPEDIRVAGCWAHARRKYAEIVKACGKGPMTAGQKIAAEAVKRIATIYHVDHMSKGKTEAEILEHRKQSVAPLVNAYFSWVKEMSEKKGLDRSSKLSTALNYSLNQEMYLRVFLEDPQIPLDNNDAERSIKKFCVGKHSWHIIASKKGATSSAMMYSIAETAKANGLNPFEYFKYLLEQLKEYPRDTVPEEVVKKLMPWSDTLPESCKQLKKP